MGKELFSVISAADIDSIPHYDIIDARDIELSGKTVKTLATAGLIAMTAVGCISPLQGTESALKTPASGEAVPIQALNAEEIKAITDPGVKSLFETDLALGQEKCKELPGCIEDSLLNYWINTTGGAFSYQFAGVEEGGDPAHWVVLSAKDEKTKEITDIKKDLLRKDGVMVNGVASTVFYFSDGESNNNYHLILVKMGQNDTNSEYLVYGPDGKGYKVKQDSESKSSLSHFWESPKEVEAGALQSTMVEINETTFGYPTTSESFIKTPSITGTEAEKIIIDAGQGIVLEKMKEFYRLNGLNGGNLIPAVFINEGKIYWNLFAKAWNSNFYSFTIVDEKISKETIIDFGLKDYFIDNPNVEISILESPKYFDGAIQQIIWNKNGQSIIGLFSRDTNTFIGWRDALNGKWIVDEVDFSTGPEFQDKEKLYPNSLSVEDVKNVLEGIKIINDNPWTDFYSEYNSNFVKDRDIRWSKIGLIVNDYIGENHIEPKYIIYKNGTEITKWDYILLNDDDSIAAWIQVNDLAYPNGWRWGETAMWDKNIKSDGDIFGYSLPSKLPSTIEIEKNTLSKEFTYKEGSLNRYGLIYYNGFEILIEFDQENNPLRWLDTNKNEMKWLDGASKIIRIFPSDNYIRRSQVEKIVSHNCESVFFDTNIDLRSNELPTGIKERREYISKLLSEVGINLGPAPDYRLPSDIVQFESDVIFDNEKAIGVGVYLKKVGEQGHYFIYRDIDGVVRIIYNVYN